MERLRRRPHSLNLTSFPLQHQVDTLKVPDFYEFVDPEKEMYLDLIAEKLRALAYSSLDQYLGDFRQMVANARAYNSPGCGKHWNAGEESCVDRALPPLSVTIADGLRMCGRHQIYSPCVC